MHNVVIIKTRISYYISRFQGLWCRIWHIHCTILFRCRKSAWRFKIELIELHLNLTLDKNLVRLAFQIFILISKNDLIRLLNAWNVWQYSKPSLIPLYLQFTVTHTSVLSLVQSPLAVFCQRILTQGFFCLFIYIFVIITVSPAQPSEER
jgi:hypothetical protein